MLTERRALVASALLCIFGFGLVLGTSRIGAADRPPRPSADSARQARAAALPADDQATEIATALPTVELTATFPPLSTPEPGTPPGPTETPKLPTVTSTPGPETPTAPPGSSTPETPGASATATGGPTNDTPGVPTALSATATVRTSDTPRPSATRMPTFTPSPSPTFAPFGCSEPWQVYVKAYADTVGKGGYNCPGCDGRFTDGDRYEAANCPLQPLFIVVSKAGDPQQVYFAQLVSRTEPFQDLGYLIVLCQPPPYEVRVLTRNPLCYTLCPNSPQTYILRQRDFDRNRNSRPGTGRYSQVDWRFWHCGLGTPGPSQSTAGCAILPVAERSCEGRKYPGLNGDFESPATDSLDAEYWYNEQYAVRAWGPVHPARGKYSMRLNPLGPGLDFKGRVVHDVELTGKSPKVAQLSLDIHWSDVGGSGFSLSAQLGKNAPVKLADQTIPQADWVRKSIWLDRGAITGRTPITLTWQIANGADVYIDNVEVDFCCAQADPTDTPRPPTRTPLPPSDTPAPPTRTPTGKPTATATDTPERSTATHTPVRPSDTATPVRDTATPVRPPDTATPERDTATPVRVSATPVRDTATPLRASATPERDTATPVRASATPVRDTATPIRASATPVRATATPLRPSATPEIATPQQLTATPTPRVPSATPVQPSATATRVPPDTATPERATATPGEPATATATPIRPPNTATPDDSVPPSRTPTVQASPSEPSIFGTPDASATATATASPTATASATPEPPDRRQGTPANTRRPGTPGTPDPLGPGPGIPGDCAGGACLVIRKFHDLDRDGRYDALEPMLPQIPFVITVDQSEVRISTDTRGVIRVCWPSPVDAQLEELTRLTGGQWFTTSPQRDRWPVACGDNEVWVGNAQIGVPRTGTRGRQRDWQAGGGPQRFL